MVKPRVRQWVDVRDLQTIGPSFTARAPRDERFKGKSVIDTAVYRGGDALAGWGFAGLESLGLGLSLIAWSLVPFTAAWAAFAARLGRHIAASVSKGPREPSDT